MADPDHVRLPIDLAALPGGQSALWSTSFIPDSTQTWRKRVQLFDQNAARIGALFTLDIEHGNPAGSVAVGTLTVSRDQDFCAIFGERSIDELELLEPDEILL